MSAAHPLTTPTPIDRHMIARDFREMAKGKLQAAQIDSIAEALVANVAKYPANGAITSLGIWVPKIQVNINNGKSFNGSGSGLLTLGGGVLIGDVYTPDINKLYADAVGWWGVFTNVYAAVQFVDNSGNQVGTFQAGAVSTVTGHASGTGHWS